MKDWPTPPLSGGLLDIAIQLLDPPGTFRIDGIDGMLPAVPRQQGDRMSALLTADEAAALHVGVNVIVRPGDEGRWAYQDEHNVWQPGASYCDPPKAWVALTGRPDGMAFNRPTDNCVECGGFCALYESLHGRPCPDCRDGRKMTDFGHGVKAVVDSVEPEPDGRNWRITLDVVEVAG